MHGVVFILDVIIKDKVVKEERRGYFENTARQAFILLEVPTTVEVVS